MDVERLSMSHRISVPLHTLKQFSLLGISQRGYYLSPIVATLRSQVTDAGDFINKSLIIGKTAQHICS